MNTSDEASTREMASPDLMDDCSSSRDDERCRGKYTTYWEQYCKRVPYKILPYVY